MSIFKGFNEDNRSFIHCPWCKKFSLAPNANRNVILVYNCSRCDMPILLFEGKAYKMDEDAVNSEDCSLIEDYVFSFLESKGFKVVEDNEGFDSDVITREEVFKMRNFLKHFRIPREGDIF